MTKINWKINKISINNFKKLIILKINNNLKGKNKIIFKKADYILNNFLNKNMLIYKGHFYRHINITKFILNYKYGEFVFTRKPFRYKIKLKK